MAHGHFGGMQVACLLWQRVCSEKFPSRTSLSGGFGKEAFLCVPLLLGSKRAVSPKCGHEPIFGVRQLGSTIWLLLVGAKAQIARYEIPKLSMIKCLNTRLTILPGNVPNK